MNATQGHGGAAGRPRCYNRDPMREYAANDGYDAQGRLQTVTIPWAFSQDCKNWVADPSTDPVPMMEGWRCDGCRHFPAESVKLAHERRLLRRMASE